MKKSNKELAIKLVGKMIKADQHIDFARIKELIKHGILMLDQLDEELKK